MASFNTFRHFFYRQFFITPPAAPSSLQLEGRNGLITGANSGLGYHAANQVLSHGLSHLIMGVRNIAKGEAARESLLASLKTAKKTGPDYKPPTIEVWQLDMESYESVLAFATRLEQSGIQLDFALLNIGVAVEKWRIASGNQYELQTQVNWLSNALLTLRLLQILEAQTATSVAGSGEAARRRPVITITGTDMAGFAKFKERKTATKQGSAFIPLFNDQANFDLADRYATSKLLFAMFIHKLTRQRIEHEHSVIINIANPGLCYGTSMHDTVTGTPGFILETLKRIVGRPAQVGARTLVYATVIAGEESNGKYLSDCKLAPFPDLIETEEGRALEETLWEELMQELAKATDVKELVKGLHV